VAVLGQAVRSFHAFVGLEAMLARPSPVPRQVYRHGVESKATPSRSEELNREKRIRVMIHNRTERGGLRNELGDRRFSVGW